MDKLQWFKFCPSDWTMGKIQRCSEITQARFIRLCCLYWNKECQLAADDAVIELDEEHFDILVSKKIIKVESNYICIDFLDEQMDDINIIRKQASDAGKASAAKRSTKVQRPFNDRSTESNRVEKSRVDKKREENIILPFNSEKFINAWNVWKDYKKKEHKFTYKSEHSERAALMKLANDSLDNESVAMEMIFNSIANGYKGIFKEKNNGKESITKDRERELREIISRTYS
jgi:hypothetical protein